MATVQILRIRMLIYKCVYLFRSNVSNAVGCSAVNEFHSLVPLNKSNIMDDIIIFHLTTDFSPDVSMPIVFFRLRFAAISFEFFRISFVFVLVFLFVFVFVAFADSIRGVCLRNLLLPLSGRIRTLKVPRRWHTFCNCDCDGMG